MTNTELQKVLDEQLSALRKLAATLNRALDKRIALNGQTAAALRAQKRQLLNK